MTVSESGSSQPGEPPEGDRLSGLVDHATVAPDTSATLPVECPFDGEQIGTLPAGGAADVELALDRAERAQEAWAERPVEERAEVLVTAHDLVLDHQEELLDVVQVESGKARRHAHEEVLDVALTASYYATRAADYLAPEKRRAAIPGLSTAEVHHHPVGVVGIISPWNYPLALAVSDAIPALLAGNAVVLKPAEQTTYSALAGVELLREAGLPEDVFQVVPGTGPDVGPHLVDGVDYLGFTGSSETGRKVATQAAENLTKCSLELGGKNPAVVLPDADLDAAVEGLVRGCFTNAGQLCISIERIYVHEAVRDEFLERFVAAIEDLTVDAGYDYDVEVGSLVSERQLEKVEDHVADARANGATVVTGGGALPEVGPYYYAPTVLTDVPEDATLFREETFGPVVSVYEVADAEEAVDRANDSEYGLNASVWTGNERRGVDVATEIECGTVNVNEGYAAAFAAKDAPMGGMNDSGVGRRHGEEGLLKYTESQTVAVQKRLRMTNPPGVPYDIYARLMNAGTRIMSRLPGFR